MKRHHWLIATFACIVFAIIAPALAAVYTSSVVAAHREQIQLTLFATYAIERTDTTFSGVSQALMQTQMLTDKPCSKEHMDDLKRIAIETRPITEIGYFDDGLLKCTSWGMAGMRVAAGTPAFTTRNGVKVVLNMTASIPTTANMLGLQRGAYCILIDPKWFVDEIVPKGVQIAVASPDGTVVAALNHPDPAVIRQFLKPSDTKPPSRYLGAVVRGSDWTAIAITPRASIWTSMQEELLVFLPIAGVISTGMVILTIWLSRRRLSLRGELAIAIRRREFTVVYQPLIELKTGICVGAEALVRWRRPDGAMVMPDLFIPIAENSKMISQITEQVVANTVRDLGDVLAADEALHVAINMAADDLAQGRILTVVQRAIRGTGIRTEQIWLEATERGFMDPKSTRTIIEKARELGHSIAIDDFGTGYSSLHYLQELPVDTLKIDKSFISTLGTDSATSPIAAHIIAMAKSLDLIIVAEGIERQEQADYLIAHGVQFGQGWLYSPPLPAQEFIEFYKAQKATKGAGPAIIRKKSTHKSSRPENRKACKQAFLCYKITSTLSGLYQFEKTDERPEGNGKCQNNQPDAFLPDRPRNSKNNKA
ncbi:MULTISPECIES: EAL domain-containing protein [Brucella]|uniref:cyclic-guanylate-specific phosphodiesterase n=3 Tax=Brucella TaxID=234 RepID=C0G9S3_9HYPH|nr:MULTISPECIES: EAL domain-containing protein [Brucella]AEK55791.1 EAL domain protein [Brucella pinnipedialis B2/94]AHB01106.1 EAL domain-containing protein [Brucella ceti TE10759-12]AHB03498.1 EAL domain-containing protein [Brucella ceti TE28753-12]AIJ66373.1 EAL domain protein [Brucella suis]AIJ72576.1 EAL domain protein [Brucella pinnipedialis]